MMVLSEFLDEWNKDCLKYRSKGQRETMECKISVTEHDIRRGTRGIPAKCPIAFAIKRVLGVDFVSVGTKFIEVVKDQSDRDSLHIELVLPDIARSFIRRFDAIQPFLSVDSISPIEFVLDVPEELVKE